MRAAIGSGTPAGMRATLPIRRPRVALVPLLLLGACQAEFPKGSPLNPIRIFFVTSSEVSAVKDSSEKVARHLAKTTGLEFVPVVTVGYVSAIEGLGTADADLAFLPTNAYIKASERFGAEVALVVTRADGEKHYRAQFIARADSGIHGLEDLAGKVWGYADTNSTSGYTIPSQMLAIRGIRVREEKTTGTHPNTVQQVYDRTIDFGTTYWSPGGRDAREKLLVTYADVFDRVKIVALTDEIPNDTVTFRRGFDPEMKRRITTSLKEYARSTEGRRELHAMYQIEGLDDVDEAFYADFRRLLRGEATKPAAANVEPAATPTQGEPSHPYRLALGRLAAADVARASIDRPSTAYVPVPEDVGANAVAALRASTADFALLDWPRACEALVDGHPPIAVAGRAQAASWRRVVALRRRTALAAGLDALGPGTAVVAVAPPEGAVDSIGELALVRAYARALGLSLPTVTSVPDGQADLVLMLEPLGPGAMPPWRAELEPIAFSPPFPHAVAVASKKLPPSAFGRLRELVLSGTLTFPGADGFVPPPVAAFVDSARFASGALDLAYVAVPKGKRGGARPFPDLAPAEALGLGWWMQQLAQAAKRP